MNFAKLSSVIFTEFNTDKFRKSGCRADLILAQMDFEKDEKFWGNCVKNYISVFELKFKGDYSTAAEDIYKDYEKVKKYIEHLNLGEHCRYYIATIWECYPDSKQWIDNEEWAKNKLTELNADYNSKGKMNFYIREHK